MADDLEDGQMKVIPRNCTYNQLCELPRDHSEVGDFCLLTDSYTVSLREQPVGDMPVQRFRIPRKTFNRLLQWYLGENRNQHTRRKK